MFLVLAHMHNSYHVFFHALQIIPPSLFTSPITLSTHLAISSLVCKLILLWTMPLTIIHVCPNWCTQSLKKPTSTGWQRGNIHSVVYLYPVGLDPLEHQSYHVAEVGIKDDKGDDMVQHLHNIRHQHLVDPCHHQHLIHPGICLAVVLDVQHGVRWKLPWCNPAFWYTLKDNHWQKECANHHRYGACQCEEWSNILNLILKIIFVSSHTYNSLCCHENSHKTHKTATKPRPGWQSQLPLQMQGFDESKSNMQATQRRGWTRLMVEEIWQ